MLISDIKVLRQVVDREVQSVKATDVHTHLYSPRFGDLLLWGVDELITYHYLIAETFRWLDSPYEDYWQLRRAGAALLPNPQADLIWRTLFVENSPVAESCRGVLTALSKLGLDVSKRDLDSYRRYFANLRVEDYVDTVFALSGVKEVVMTNDPFDDAEREVWLQGPEQDPRFRAALRLDALLNTWEMGGAKLARWGYAV